jgi:threonine/homoserine/homoserine lactone efflux protein
MPRKWIIFQVASALIMLLSLAMVSSITIQFINPDRSQTEVNLIINALIFVGFSIMLFFAALCTYLLQSRFPDKYISPRVTLLFKVFGVLFVIFTVFLLLGLIAITPELIKNASAPSGSNTVIYMLIAFGVYIIICIWFFVAAQKLAKLIKRAFLAGEQAAIDSLGDFHI